MTVTVNLHTEEQEKALIEFLERMEYDYESLAENRPLSELQMKEVIKRDNDFIAGKTTARDWDDIKRDLRSVYR
jgi:hypothetical protein